MKKTTKKLLTFALSTLFVGAGLGGSIAAYNAINTNVASAEETAEKTTVNFAEAIQVNGQWGKGDFAGNMAHVRLNAQSLKADWIAAGEAVNNAKLPATVLDNVWVNGTSISQHNAEYKALIESGATSPITWDTTKSFSPEIADDVNNNKAVYAPIFIKLVNYGTDLAGSTIDIYSPNSYLSAADITEVRITKDFAYETDAYKFCVADDVIFKSNSLCKPDKYIGEANVPSYNFEVKTTEVMKADGRDGSASIEGSDKFLSFYLSGSDYTGINTVAFSDLNFLKSINYFDYILIDGVKLGTLWNYSEPNERFFNVWNRSNSFSTRWPTGLGDLDAQKGVSEIKILAGCQFPSYSDPTGTIYEVKEDTTLVKTADGLFINEEYFITDENLTVSEATVAGEAGELLAFDITFDKWNSTCNIYDYNYFGAHYQAMRKNILLNGVSLFDINANVDDSSYTYSTSPWTNDTLDPTGTAQLFQNPTLITGEENKLTIYVHKQLVIDKNWNTIEVTLAKDFNHHATPAAIMTENITATVWKKPVNVTLDGVATTYKYGDTVTLTAPTEAPAGKTFVKWVDAEDNEVTEFTAKNDVAFTSVWENIPYTAKVVKADGAEVEVSYTVDNRAEKLAEIKAMLPENTADYVYSWAEALPAELALNNDQVFTVVAKTYEEMTITEALAAADGTMIKVSGTVAQVDTAWSGKFNNITVTLVDEAGAELYVYRLATKVELGDVITVKGVMGSYNSSKQVAAGATAEVTAHNDAYAYEEKTVLEAIEVADDVNVSVTGTVVKIKDAYAAKYDNMSVYIADEAGNQLYIYRLIGEVALNDIVIIKGIMATHSGARQVVSGGFEKIGTHECSNYTDATCKAPAACVVCGVAKDDVLADHNYVDGFCTVCEAECPYVVVDLAIDQEVEITIPAGKYAKAEVYTMVGGYVLVYYWQDLIIEINGEEYAYEPVKLLSARQGANEIIIKSVSGEAVTDTITLSPYTQDEYTMNVGANEVYVLDAQAGRNATFTADVDGEYTFSFAEGEANGEISLLVESEYGTSSEMITMPYTVTLAAGETVTFAIGTMNWETDTIEINVDAPYVTSEIWLGKENTISIPEGKYFFSNVYSFVGGKFTASWTGDVTVEINGEAVENGAVVELMTSYEGANTFVIKAANNAAAEVVLNVANYKEPATPIAVGNVNVTVVVENFYCEGVEVIFTATEAGEYKLSVAEGEENAAVTLVEGNVTELIEELPYSFTLEAGESITFIIATANVMVESDEINLVLEKVEVTPPAGGDDEGEGEGEGTNPPADDDGEGEGTNPPASDEEEKPGIIDKITGVIPQPIKDMVGCSGVVGGIAGGAAALGLAVVALLKKKEDNE